MMSLYMERETDRKRVLSVASKDEAARLVDMFEEKGFWPEGYDAVVEQGADRRWLYTSEGSWEQQF